MVYNINSSKFSSLAICSIFLLINPNLVDGKALNNHRHNTFSSTHSSLTSKLNIIFSREMIGAQVGYLEKYTGPAWKVENGVAEYNVSDCVIVAVKGNNNDIKGLGLLNVSDKCKFDLKGIFGNSSNYVNKMTFGKIEAYKMDPGEFYSDCIHFCGNASIPIVYEKIETPHVYNFYEIIAGVKLIKDDAINASIDWQNSMKFDGEEYIIATKFNCERRYDEAASKAFKNIQITYIFIGQDSGETFKNSFCKN